MSEENQTDLANLANQLGEETCDTVDISYPMLPANTYPFVVKKAEVVNNADETGKNIKIQWENAQEQQSTKGEQLLPGQIVISSYVGLTEKPARTENGKSIKARTLTEIKKDMAKVLKATSMSGTSLKDFLANPSMIEGRQAMVKVGVRKETSDFPESNEIKSLVIEG